MKKISEALGQNTGICKDAIVDSAAKISQSFEKDIIEILLLYMVVPERNTPHIGRFWSGCAGAVKRGLEIMGLGLVNLDAHNCMMLRAHQTLCSSELKMRNKSLTEHYIGVIKRYSKELLRLSIINHIFKKLFGYAV